MFSRILYIGFGGKGPQYEWLDLNLIDELRREGVKVSQISLYRNQTGSEIAKIISSEIKSFRPDLLLSGLDDDICTDEVLFEITKCSCARVLICFDNLSVPHIHKKTAKAYDLVWLTSNENRHLFVQWGANTIVQPYAANPYLYNPSYGNEYEYSVCFIGTLYGSRKNKLDAIAASGSSVRVYGKSVMLPIPLTGIVRNPFEKLEAAARLASFPIGRAALIAALKKSLIREKPNALSKIEFSDEEITFSKMASIYSKAKLSMNICELWNTYLLKNPVYKLHLRTFEIPMSGGVQVAPRTNEIETYFEDKTEILLYESDAEMVDLIKHFSQERLFTEREKIRTSARRRSVAEHTWSRRIKRVYQEL